MKPFPDIITDIHTHHVGNPSSSIYNIRIGFDHTIPDTACWISAGIHPWDSEHIDTNTALSELERLAKNDSRLLAIGECGIDMMHGRDQMRQEEIFKRQIEISERYDKPVILHCVRAFDRILYLYKLLRPAQPWIIHGFRGKPELASQLTRFGIGISLGEHFNHATASVIPDDLLFTESDESTIDIEEIRRHISKTRM